MSRLLCLKNVALAVSVSDFIFFFHCLIHRTVVFTAMRVVDFKGGAYLSESNRISKLLFLKYCLCPVLHGVAMLVGLCC